MRSSSSGVTGWPVAGLMGGRIGNGRSASTLYHWRGISLVGSVTRSLGAAGVNGIFRRPMVCCAVLICNAPLWGTTKKPSERGGPG